MHLQADLHPLLPQVSITLTDHKMPSNPIDFRCHHILLMLSHPIKAQHSSSVVVSYIPWQKRPEDPRVFHPLLNGNRVRELPSWTVASVDWGASRQSWYQTIQRPVTPTTLLKYRSNHLELVRPIIDEITRK